MAAWAAFGGALAAQDAWRAPLEEARERAEAGDVRAALAVLDRAVREHERAAPLFALRARYRTWSRDLDGALADADRAVELDATLVEAWIERGYLRMVRNELPAAIADFDEAVRLAPTNKVALGDRGDARLRLKDWLGARADYDAALAIDPAFGAALHNRALANFAMCAWRAAAVDQAAAVHLLPPDARMWTILADVQMQLGRWRAALRSVERGLACERPDVVALLVNRAWIHWRLGERDEAIEARRRSFAAAASPKATALQSQQLGCLLLAVGELAAAREAFAAAGQEPTLRPWATVMAWCAHADNATADRELRAAIAAWPADTPTWATRMAEQCLAPAEFALPQNAEEADHACAAALLRGWRARRDGHAAEARRWFLVCIDTGRTDSAQWQVAYAAAELDARTPATLGCEVRAVPDAEPPRLEVTSLTTLGPAALQGARVGDRIAMVDDQPATMAAFANAAKACVLGTRVRFVIEGDPRRLELRVAAGAATK